MEVIGTVFLKVEYTPTGEILETTFNLEEREHGVSYLWVIKGKNGNLIAARGNGIDQRVLKPENKLQQIFEHALYNINNYLLGRKRIFKVIEFRLVPTGT